ncbi:MAG: NADH-quinone oxidoreductase subunit H [Planctomycetota bacterium]
MAQFWPAVFYLLFFLGCALVTAVVGFVASYIDRKVTALVQARKGPPVLQPFYDFVKFMGKETLIPAGANRMAFLLMPLVALAAVSLAATILFGNILWQNGMVPPYRFVGDVIVVLYLLVVPSAALVIGASSSNNPFATVGASREVKLMSYELPMLLAVAAALTLTAGSSRRFADKSQEQVDNLFQAEAGSTGKGLTAPGANRLPPDCPLVSRAAKESEVKFRKNEKLGKTISRDRILSTHFASSKGAIDALRADYLAAREAVRRAEGSAQRVAAANNEKLAWKALEGREDRLCQTAAGIAAEMEKDVEQKCKDLADELGVLGEDLWRRETEDSLKKRPALEKRYRAVKADREKYLDMKSLTGLVRDLRVLPQRIAALEAAVAAAPAGKPLGAVLPLQFQEILAMRGAGPGREPFKGRALQRVSDVISRRKLNVHGTALAAVRSGLAESALAAEARGRPLDRLISSLVLGLCVLVVFLCIHAKLGLVPFDCAEADCEIAGGVLIEYGGPLLGVWKLVKCMLLVVLPLFLGMVFLGGFQFYVQDGVFSMADVGQAAVSVLKYVLVLVFIVLVRNTNPRVRVDQAMRFFLGPIAFLAFVALMLAVLVYWWGGAGLVGV